MAHVEIRPGDRIALLVPGSEQYVDLVLGLLAAPAAVSISSVNATCVAIMTRWTRRPCDEPMTRRAR